MAGNLDQISSAIGELRAKAEEAGEWRQTTALKIDEIREYVVTSGSRIETVERRIEAMEPEVESWRRAKYKAAGALGIVGAASATISFLAAKFGAFLGILR